MRKVLRKLLPPDAVTEEVPTAPNPEASQVDWGAVQPQMPTRKKMISLRLDADVVAFFQSDGKGYQTRMNAVLRSYMNARKDSL